MEPVSEAQARARLWELPGWEVREGALYRQFTFGGFADAVAFVVRVGFLAEAADHHPDIQLSYKKVALSFSTHSAGGLTQKDFEGATAAGDLARRTGVGGSGG